MWHNPSQQYITCALEGREMWPGKPKECVPVSCFSIISTGTIVASISHPISSLLSVEYAAWGRENTPKTPLSSKGALHRFTEDASKENFNRRLRLRCSRSRPSGVFPSFSSCFLTQNSWTSLWGSMFQCYWEPSMCVQQLYYIGGGCWVLFFFHSPALCCRLPFTMVTASSLSPCFLFLSSQ